MSGNFLAGILPADCSHAWQQLDDDGAPFPGSTPLLMAKRQKNGFDRGLACEDTQRRSFSSLFHVRLYDCCWCQYTSVWGFCGIYSKQSRQSHPHQTAIYDVEVCIVLFLINYFINYMQGCVGFV